MTLLLAGLALLLWALTAWIPASIPAPAAVALAVWASGATAAMPVSAVRDARRDMAVGAAVLYASVLVVAVLAGALALLATEPRHSAVAWLWVAVTPSYAILLSVSALLVMLASIRFGGR